MTIGTPGINEAGVTVIVIFVGALSTALAVYAAVQILDRRQELALRRRGQISERFTKAIEQLSDRTKLDIRLGGIYGLEQLTKDAYELHWPVMEVLTAFLRERSQSPSTWDGAAEGEMLPADIQAALTVIARRRAELDTGILELSSTNLKGASVELGNLQRANLRGANLHGARLERANLRGSNLSEANLQEANLVGALLPMANLQGADLQRAYLVGATFEEARLGGANLREATLERANLQQADLREAVLEHANLREADLYGARLPMANLRQADFSRANLHRTYLQEANFVGARLDEAQLGGVDLTQVIGLTQEQLDSAIFNESTKPPPGLTVTLKPSLATDTVD